MSLAIAYRMHKKKKCHGGEMAEGGPVGGSYDSFAKGVKNAFMGPEAKAAAPSPMPEKKDPKDSNPATSNMKKAFKTPGYAEGGEVEEMESGYEPMPHPCEKCGHVSHPVENQGMGEEEDMISRIMKKRRMFSKGGRVANDTEPMVDEEPAEYDDLVKDDDLEFHETGKNSGDELGNEQEDEDRGDIVSRIMKSRKKKDKMPHPA